MRGIETITKLTEGGRIVIPADIRKSLQINIGDEVVLLLEEDSLLIVSKQTALRRAQELVSRYASNRELASELIIERTQEARNHE
jgi:AbrB family looped-hinge helix DNA binding protein